MKSLKLLMLTLALMLNVSLSFANIIASNELEGNLKMIEFNYSSEIDYEKQSEVFYDAESSVMVHVFSMKCSEEKLISYENEDILIPIAFVNISAGIITYKDINNRKDVLIIDKNNKSLTYLEDNDSKQGLALAKKECMGGSTLGCIMAAESACAADWECDLYCNFVGWRCHAAIIIACAVSCNNDNFIEP